ncbi:MAG: hypothetical protein Q9M21_07620 [Mariprofundaceae bacterium]|nr:hypothetical protein [Mariprofundaceae bacterium]
MIRLLSIVIMMGFLSVGYIDNSYADSDREHDKYEQKHEKHDDDRSDKYERESDHKQDTRSQRDSRSQGPVSQRLDAVSNGVDKAARKIKQAKEWWQFW